MQVKHQYNISQDMWAVHLFGNSTNCLGISHLNSLPWQEPRVLMAPWFLPSLCEGHRTSCCALLKFEGIWFYQITVVNLGVFGRKGIAHDMEEMQLDDLMASSCCSPRDLGSCTLCGISQAHWVQRL